MSFYFITFQIYCFLQIFQIKKDSVRMRRRRERQVHSMQTHDLARTDGSDYMDKAAVTSAKDNCQVASFQQRFFQTEGLNSIGLFVTLFTYHGLDGNACSSNVHCFLALSRVCFTGFHLFLRVLFCLTFFGTYKKFALCAIAHPGVSSAEVESEDVYIVFVRGRSSVQMDGEVIV